MTGTQLWCERGEALQPLLEEMAEAWELLTEDDQAEGPKTIISSN